MSGEYADSGSEHGSATNTPLTRRLARGGPGTASREVAGGAVDDLKVAEFLLREKYFLAALELHQELLERNHGTHTVQALHDFFRDESKIDALTSTEASMDVSISTTLAGVWSPRPFGPPPSVCSDAATVLPV